MNYAQFIEQVRDCAQLDSKEQAEKITVAALETLGERLSRQERNDLAAQLPPELKKMLNRRPTTDRFSLEEFYNRFGARAGLTYGDAVKQSHEVMRVMCQAAASRELDDILAEFPDEYLELFGKAPQSPASPTYTYKSSKS